MRVAVFLTTPPDTYSGGRYNALILAEGLAAGGHETYVVTNHRPIFFDDFSSFPDHASVRLQLTEDFRNDLPEGNFDFVILIPGTGMPGFYLRVELFALQRDAHLVFFNFETPNWFNSLSPAPRPESDWRNWVKACKYASLVLANSAESAKWARKYYQHVRPGTLFEFCYPSINTPAADSLQETQRERRLLLFMRFSSSLHKGSGKLHEIFCEAMRGYTLVLILGKEELPADVSGPLLEIARKFDVQIEVKHRLSDVEKFREMKRARLLLFPSYFEGYGYPPVEAQYCNLPCVAFDLPVLRETSGDRIYFAEHGNFSDFRAKIEFALSAELSDEPILQKEIAPVARLESCTEKLNELFGALLKQGLPIEGRSPARMAWLKFLDEWNLIDLKLRYLRFRSRARKLAYKTAGTIIRSTHRIRRRRRRVVYYPAFSSPEELTDHYHRACWYLPRVPGRCEEVCLFHEMGDGQAIPGDRPEHMAPPPNPPDHIYIHRGRRANFRMLFAADLVVFWQQNPDRRLMKVLDRFLGIKSAYVATDDISAMEYGEYCGLIWEYMTSKKERTAFIQDSRERFERMAVKLKGESVRASCVFGTGPSLEKASDFDFSDTLCIVCNSILQDEALMDHIRPRFICAGDVVSHFGVSVYANEFRADLIKALRNRDVVLLTTAKYGSMMLHHYPDLADKILLIEQTQDGPVYDLIADYEAPRLASTVNIHMLPLAATFSKHIWLLGCDGKNPAGDNEDFWAHAKRAQYHDLVDSGHRCHPTFDLDRQLSTYGRYVQSITQTIEEGVERGISYGSLHASFVPVIGDRSVRRPDLDAAALSVPYRVTELWRFIPE